MLARARRALAGRAAAWSRPYTSVQWAWVRALGVEPSRAWRECSQALPRHAGGLERAEAMAAMAQRFGVRGL